MVDYIIGVDCSAFALCTTPQGSPAVSRSSCKNAGKKLLSYGFYNIGVIYSSVALHIRASNLIF